MTAQLTHADNAFINFANGSFQWVDIKRFRFAGVADDRGLLAALIQHDLYGDNYAGGTPGDDPQRHGPYWRNRLIPDSYVRTCAEAEEGRLRCWAEQYVPLAGHLAAELERELYLPLRSGDQVYRLQDLGRDAFHDWGGVHNEFHELVLINRCTSRLCLVVAADD